MTDAQRPTYGDGVDPDHLPPVDVGGQAALLQRRAVLLQLAVLLRAALRHRPLRPLPARTPTASGPGTTTCWPPPGPASAAELAGRFGIDIGSEAFWTASLDVIRARIDEFVALVDAGPGSSDSAAS